MIDNNIITPKERLMIAAQILSGSFNLVGDKLMGINPPDAMLSADALIKQSGCIVAGAEHPEYSMD